MGHDLSERGRAFAWAVLAACCVLLLVSSRSAGAPGLLRAALLVSGALVTARVLLVWVGGYAPLLVAVLAFASGLPALVRAPWSDNLAWLAVLLGLAVLFGGRRLPGQPVVSEIYQGEADAIARYGGGRLFLAGGLLAVPSLLHPECALLLPGALAAVPREERRAGSLLLLLGAAVTIASGLALGLLPGAFAELAATASLDPGLLRRNLLLVFAGRHLGILVAFLPLVLGLALSTRGSGRLVLLWCALAAVVIGVVLRPYDFAHLEAAAAPAPGLLVHRPFLALYPVFWYAATRPARPPSLVVAAAVSLLLVFPLLPAWWWPGQAQPAAPGRLRASIERWREWLPGETSQTAVRPSGSDDRREHGLVVRRLDRRAPSTLEVRLGEPARLLIASEQPLEALVLIAASPAVDDDIVLQRGTLSQLLFRPDGSVGFEIEPGAPVARHASGWSGTATYYELGFTLRRAANAPAASPPVAISLRPGRLLARER